jgi:hypothetical protein
MWAELCAIYRQYVADLALVPAAAAQAVASGDKAIIREAEKEMKSDLSARLYARMADARRSVAAKGLHSGDYNAVTFQFMGAARASRKRGALPGDGDKPMESYCGAAVVNQVKRFSPARLLHHTETRIEFIARPRSKSRRGRRLLARLHITVRGPKNPLGHKVLSVDFIMHRPLPPDAEIVEVRLMRKTIPATTRDRKSALWTKWQVAIAVATPRRVHDRADRIAGLALTWADDGSGEQEFCVVAENSGRTVTHVMEAGHAETWKRLTTQKETASTLDGEAQASALHACAVHERRLALRRREFLRVTAARLTTVYSVIAIEDMWLAGMGVKKHLAPALFRQNLKNAAKVRGTEILEVKLPKREGRSARDCARMLLEEAEKFDGDDGMLSGDEEKSQVHEAVA